MLVDAGNPLARDVDRIQSVAKEAGIRQLDYFVASHYHSDHIGGVPELARRIPIRTFVDHGPENLDQGQFRGSDALFNGYLAERAKARVLEVAPGDKVPVSALDVVVVSSKGEGLKKALPGAGAPNPLCATFEPQAEDTSENARSVGVVVQFGRFRMLALGDLTWNKERELVCPDNLLGAIDLYLTTHHGLNLSGPDVLVHAIRPRVAIMNNGPRKGASHAAWTTVKTAPGLEDFWQLHYSLPRPPNAAFRETRESGGPDLNVSEQFIANLADEAGHTPAHYLRVSAQADGSFTVVNSRQQYSRNYPPRR
jgi:competence protein ComEC